MQAKDVQAEGHVGSAAVKAEPRAAPGTGQAQQQQHELPGQEQSIAEGTGMADAPAKPSTRAAGAAQEAGTAPEEEEQHDGRPAKKQRLGALPQASCIPGRHQHLLPSATAHACK